MTNDKIALQDLLEKSSDASLLREMIGYAAQRLMVLEAKQNPSLRVEARADFQMRFPWHLPRLL